MPGTNDPSTGLPPTNAQPPAAPPASAAPAPTAPPAAPPSQEPTTDEGEKLSFTRETFNKRLEQAKTSAASSAWKELGFESREEALEFKKAADERAKAEQEAERAKMDELERYKADLAERDAKIAEAEAAREEAVQAAEAARVEAHLHRVFVDKGIKNPDYALFKLEQAVNALEGDDAELDENEFLDGLMADPVERAALGLEAVAQQPGQSPKTPAQTTAPTTKPNPREPSGVQGKHVSQMTADEWAQHKRDLMNGN